MNLVPGFEVGEQYTNDQIRLSLQLENLGGIRPALDAHKRLRHVAIMTAAEESGRLRFENPYNDRIENDVLIYTAQGREGDQTITGRNKRLLEQYSLPIPLYGFTNVGRQIYKFLGLLELMRHYQESQTDRHGTMRKVWVFEFKIHDAPHVIPLDQAAAIVAGLINTARQEQPWRELEREVDGTYGTSSSVEFPEYSIEETRGQLLQVDPYRFEHLIKILMEFNGFARVQVTSASGDGGIDLDCVVGEQYDFLAQTHVQVQAKRWRHSVGSVEINGFRGALSTTAKGVFVTTSHYTRAAIAEANHNHKMAVTLIDGPRLAAMVIRDRIDLSRL